MSTETEADLENFKTNGKSHFPSSLTETEAELTLPDSASTV